MRRILDIIVCLAALLVLSSCAERMEGQFLPCADKGIVIDFSSAQSKAMTYVEDEDYESRIDHMDIFVFDHDNRIYWHERVSVSSEQGSHILSKGTKFFAQKDAAGNVIGHPEYKVYLLANCAAEMTFDGESLCLTSQSGKQTDITSLSALRSSVQEDINLHLSGLNVALAPTSFLMDAVATSEGNQIVHLSDSDPDKNIVLNAEFARAAAKVVITIKEGDKIEFTEGDDLLRKGLFDKSEHGLYYVRNLPFKTYLFSGAYDITETDRDRLRTTVKTNNAHFTWVPSTFHTDTLGFKGPDSHRDQIRLVTYVYEHSWDNKGVFDFEPCVVVNLPLISIQEGGQTHYQAHANSWYKIPMTKGEEFKRNNLYKVNVTINYAGATTVMEPVEVPDIRYEVENYQDGLIGWNTEEVHISQADRPKYLTLNMKEVAMHNSEENDFVQFASSRNVSVTINSVYYYDKYGTIQYLARPGSNVGASLGDSIKVSAPAALSGKVLVQAPVPKNNAPRYIEVKVSNGESTDQYFTVTQYPLEYITNIQAYYSYRDDFGGTTYEKYASTRYVAVGGWKESTQTWGTYSNTGGNNSTYMFTSKVAKPSSNGKSSICYYKWSRSGKNYAINDKESISGLVNGRMYHVKLTSSSADYSVGIPQLDSKGWTSDGQDNKLLVAPSFMIASQLGATYAPTSMAQAASHCYHYVETYKDEFGHVVHLDDWRLPTEAEIKIIIKFQYMENAAMDEVLSGRYYWSATGQVENTRSQSSSTTSAVRCIRNAFK